MPRAAKPQKKLILLWAGALVVSALIIPTVLVKRVKMELPIYDPIYEWPVIEQKQEPVLMIPVYLSRQERVIEVPLEGYVRGVVAAEMPAEFELEALKAQAIAARTYIVRKIVERDFTKAPSPEAWVTDTASDQVYATDEELRARWTRREYAEKISKINRAVAETRGLILTYDGQPIDATYFSTSNGYTENSEEYWSETIPYLRSVASPWDAEISPKYTSVTKMSLQEMMEKLGLQDLPASAMQGGKLGMAVAERTSGKRIKTVLINGIPFSGREVREKLGLPSSEFTWKISGDSIEFTTYGYGHGVGMSQYGANGMALEGAAAEEILTYYYKGVEIVDLDQVEGWQDAARPLTSAGSGGEA